MAQIQRAQDPRNLDVTYIYCKQLFAPWEDLDEDPQSIDLIYNQIINGRVIFSSFYHKIICFIFLRYSN